MSYIEFLIFKAYVLQTGIKLTFYGKILVIELMNNDYR